MTKTVTVTYNRPDLEKLLRPIAMWLDINVRDALTLDTMDRTGYLLSNVYDALAEFLLTYSQRVLDRGFNTIVENHLKFNFTFDETPMNGQPMYASNGRQITTRYDTYDNTPNHPQFNQFLSDIVYPNFERIAQFLSGGINASIQHLAMVGYEVENIYFYHHSHNVGIVVLQGVEVETNDEPVYQTW